MQFLKFVVLAAFVVVAYGQETNTTKDDPKPVSNSTVAPDPTGTSTGTTILTSPKAGIGPEPVTNATTPATNTTISPITTPSTPTLAPNTTISPSTTTPSAPNTTLAPTPNTTIPTPNTTIPTPNTTIPTPITTTTLAPTTVSPTPASTSTAAPVTAAPDTGKDRHFDGPSFIGGMVLTIGTLAIGFVAFKFYVARTGRNYRTL